MQWMNQISNIVLLLNEADVRISFVGCFFITIEYRRDTVLHNVKLLHLSMGSHYVYM